MTRSRKNKIPVLILVTYLVLFYGGLQNFVLCVGEDGHVGLKSVLLGTCRETVPLAKRPPTAPMKSFISVNADCGPCVDIPLSLHSVGVAPLRAAGNGIPSQHAEVACICPTSTIDLSWADHLTPLPVSIGPPNPDLPAIATVVLLI